MERIAIAGVPRAGKTTLAADLATSLGCEANATDSLIELGWSEASATAAEWFDRPGPFVIEGVAVPRALRKWLRSHPDGKPCDKLYWLGEPREVLSDGQARMAKGCITVLEEVLPALIDRGVEIISEGPTT